MVATASRIALACDGAEVDGDVLSAVVGVRRRACGAVRSVMVISSRSPRSKPRPARVRIPSPQRTSHGRGCTALVECLPFSIRRELPGESWVARVISSTRSPKNSRRAGHRPARRAAAASPFPFEQARCLRATSSNRAVTALGLQLPVSVAGSRDGPVRPRIQVVEAGRKRWWVVLGLLGGGRSVCLSAPPSWTEAQSVLPL